MMKFSHRLWALVCALLLLPGLALADIAWPADMTAGQTQLQAYIDRVNANQDQQGSSQVNALFECYPTFAVLGVTAQDMAEIPEGIELSVTITGDSLTAVQLRVSDPGKFAALAASCIQAASPTAIDLTDAFADPSSRASRAANAPTDSFEDEIITLPGLTPRVYYAYYPNQYRDGVNWLQMTLIFPLPGAADAAIIVTPAPIADDAALEFDLTDYDGGTHLEVFVTPTPEPDSPAGEQ